MDNININDIKIPKIDPSRFKKFFYLPLVIFLILSSLYTVDANENGVVLRLGKYYDTTNSGLHFNLPLVDQVKKIKVDYQNLNLGDVSFHHGLTFHRAKSNDSNEDRMVHTVIFFEDGSRRGDDKFHFSVDRPGIEVGQVIKSDVTPLAYPIKNIPNAPKDKISDDYLGYKMLGLLPKD